MTAANLEKDKSKAFWIMALMALYVLSPVDFIPDMAPGLGNLDDLLVMLFASKKAYAHGIDAAPRTFFCLKFAGSASQSFAGSRFSLLVTGDFFGMRIMARRTQQAVINTALSVPPGTPTWITGDLIEATIRVWQPFYNEPITTEVAVEMLIHVGQLCGTLFPKGAFSRFKET